MHSMTGYGVAAGKIGHGFLFVEIKTFNHRYCEISLKIPPRMGVLEQGLRESLQRELERGKVELFFREVNPLFGEAELVLNLSLAKQYQKALLNLQKGLKIREKINPLSLTPLNQLIQSKEKEGNYSLYHRPIQNLVERAVAQVKKMRAKEGRFLLGDQKGRLRSFAACLRRIERSSVKNAKKREAEEVVNGNGGVNKSDITEEITRLKSHSRQYDHILKSREPMGRKLDFLIQEMHREMNTIGAKACDATISQTIVESKSLLENLREQVQNIL